MPDCPITLKFTLFTTSKNSSLLSSTLKFGMDSSLSTVPPVCPSPLPDIFATFTPSEATIGDMMRVVLSPTPPVECLSTFMPSIADKSSISPDLAMASVSMKVSSSSMPEKYIAISIADI